jgi:hypothetical protein
MSGVRFQLFFGPASTHPYRMEWSLPGAESDRATARDWYGWRLIGANNRELGRSARSFVSYPRTRAAVRYLQQQVDQLVPLTLPDPATGRWGWRIELDNQPVAVSARWYERDHDSRAGLAKFVALLPAAELADGVVTLYERRDSERRDSAP